MNLASALIYQVLESEDFDTWTNVLKHYLPSEYHALFEVINKHTDNFHKLPSLEELKLEVRDQNTLDKVYALESIETEAEAHVLLEYLKNEFAQREALYQMDKWVDSSMAFETAEEVVRHIQQIGVDLEMKIELTPPEETMQKISLFESEEEMASRIRLGLNNDFDERFDFLPTDLILMGGYRGSGKSLVCSNVANRIVYEKQKKVLYFSIEMLPRELLWRDASITTKIPFYKIKSKKLDVDEWDQLAKYWAARYKEGEVAYEAYKKHRSFERFHTAISRHELIDAHLDIVYDSGLTLGRINAEVDKRLMAGEEIGLTVVDYINKVSRVGGGFSVDTLDWKEQILVSNGLKKIAQDTRIPVLSPFQTTEDGSVRLGKGILDAADAAFHLKAHKGDVSGMSFFTDKMRAADDTEVFTSEVDWNTLRIGPNSIEPPEEEQKKSRFGNKKKPTSDDITVSTSGVYDA